MNIDFGKHIKKVKGSYLKSLKEYHETNDVPFNIPSQIFTGSPSGWRLTKRNPDDETKTKEYIEKNKISLYIHSKYLINLAKPCTPEFKYQLDALQYDLTVGSKIGAKGVVVHVGKSVKETNIKKCIENMKENMRSLSIVDGCPLLLETPAGQGTELLTDINEFREFMIDFENDSNYGICIDTCHVFACGYDPAEYLDKINLPVNLVHLNDSKEPKKSKKDRHEVVGKGFIGKEILYKCIETGLPCVAEW